VKPQAEFRKVLVVWAILVGLVIVGMAVGKLMWKRRAAENREAARTAIVRDALAGVTKAFDCLKHGKRDLVTGAIVHSIETSAKKACSDEIEPLSRSLLAAAEKLDIKLEDSPSTPFLGDFDNHAQLEELCEWAGTLGAVANQLATRTRVTKVEVPPCDVEAHALELVSPPSALGSNSIAAIRAGTELQLQYRDDASHGYVMARTSDGGAWQTQAMPPHWYAGYAWSGDRFVATVSERPEDDNSPYLVQVLDGNQQWQRRARIAVPVVSSVLLHGERDIAIVASDLEPASEYQVLRSSDGGKTFPRRAKLGGTGQIVRLDVTMRPDGAALALLSRNAGATLFDVVKIDAAAKAGQVLHAFEWAASGDDHPPLLSCRDGDVHWALVRGRHLAVSEGLAWRLVKDFPDVLDVHEIACTADRFAVTSGSDTTTVRACDRKSCSEPVAFRRNDGAAVALRFDGANLALWLGNRFSQVHLRTGEPAALAVYRVEGKLVLDRVHIAETSGKLPVVRDKRGFFQLTER
jgi:hypothetical protein